MTHRHAVFVVCLVLALLASPSIVAQETPTQTANTTNETDETAGMGAQMTAFVQSSSTAANDSVENGMWEARFEQSNASERARLVTNRTGTLEQRLERLEAQNETIQERYENGTISEQAYVAQQSQLNARIDSLRTAVNDTDEAAVKAGVNDTRLERLKQNASNMSGQQVAGIAQGLAGPPSDAGPPADKGPSGDAGPPDTQGSGDGQATNSSSNTTSGGQNGGPDNPGGENSGSGGGNSGGGGNGGGSGGSGGGGGPP